ncbi:OsmC family protein [Tichowtungia aerotolerans]|uniref:OsmC family peroxiredoxin n=1 Tax=Tichowtungia aerotolerans TaxID=2697043 RepID=A0A6P1MBR4_9BACT|nr:OsmC family protein [Tichowtungia aerotolerans]QHI69984.1 OsmC family peroxiredoxin [Tichowtungia aerotolerans]
MAIKTVKVESKLDSKFKIESTVSGHQVIVDQPAAAGGNGEGPTPLEYLFVALAGCIGSVGRIIAMQKRMAVNGMTISVEGDLNADGLLGKPTVDPVGFKEIRVSVDVDADMTAEEKAAFVHEMDSRCPVSWNLLNASSVKVSAV